MGTVIRAQFAGEVLDVEVDRGFDNCQHIGNLLVFMTVTHFLAQWKDADSDIPLYRQAKAEYAGLR
jgi:hypothetical protein